MDVLRDNGINNCIKAIEEDFIKFINNNEFTPSYLCEFNIQKFNDSFQNVIFEIFSISPYIQKFMFEYVFRDNENYSNLYFSLDGENYKCDFTKELMKNIYGFKSNLNVEINSLEYAFYSKLFENKKDNIVFILKSNQYFRFIYKLLGVDYENLNSEDIESLKKFFKKSKILLPSIFIIAQLRKKKYSNRKIYKYFLDYILPNLEYISEIDLKIIFWLSKILNYEKIRNVVNEYIDNYRNKNLNKEKIKNYLDKVDIKIEKELEIHLKKYPEIMYEDYILLDIKGMENINYYYFKSLTEDKKNDDNPENKEKITIKNPINNEVYKKGSHITIKLSDDINLKDLKLIILFNEKVKYEKHKLNLKNLRFKVNFSGKYKIILKNKNDDIFDQVIFYVE
ncbi:hypothetical protein [Marinitoga sp. 1155]|uniref:hypothetical protein n=1 Tax=Marinitoga sp. 1155 TaxID=1428448 RepID=UPI00064131BB|nr:hypothetical protein [Marinitoga sp. 1155]KLO23519.1 hypothetical protein X274_06435 [Marinitoga sp. 1155]